MYVWIGYKEAPQLERINNGKSFSFFFLLEKLYAWAILHCHQKMFEYVTLPMRLCIRHFQAWASFSLTIWIQTLRTWIKGMGHHTPSKMTWPVRFMELHHTSHVNRASVIDRPVSCSHLFIGILIFSTIIVLPFTISLVKALLWRRCSIGSNRNRQLWVASSTGTKMTYQTSS